MNTQDIISIIKGHLKVEIYKGDIRTPENLLEVKEYSNLVVTVGKNLLLDRLFAINGTPTQVQDIGVGTDSTAAAAGQTQLNPSVSGSVLLQAFDSTATRSGQVVTCISTFGTGVANFSWNECGLFNGTVNGTSTMFDRIAPIGPFTKTSAVSIVLTITITQS